MHAAIAASVLVYAGVIALVTRPLPADLVVPGAPVARGEAPASMVWIGIAIAAVLLVAVALIRLRIRPASYVRLAITSWALTEAIAIIGLVLGLAHRDNGVFLPFGGASLALLLLLTPRRRDLEPI